jgi:capsular exopolysaccharide synthesis family protein
MSRDHRILSRAERDGTTRHLVPVFERERERPEPDEPLELRPRPIAWTHRDERVPLPADLSPAERSDGGHGLPVPARPVFGTKLDRELVAALSPYGPAAEQYRSLRTRIAQIEHAGPRRVLLVTSPGAGDGKTVTVANLALTMAQEFQRQVLLIDADLRSARLHASLGISREPGLSDVLTGAASLDEALVSISEHRLIALPAGKTHDRPAELLGSEPMRRLMEGLARRFDRVLVDTTAAHFADAGVLEPIADGVLLVVRAGRTSRQAITRAIGLVPRTKLLGVVLNDTRTSSR